MIQALLYMTLGLCGLYILFTLLLMTGLFRLAKHNNTAQPFVTVVIAARNEAVNIKSCLQALKLQSYPSQKIEIILVNDRSTDRTIEQAQNCTLPNLTIISVTHQDHLCPKKNALHQGIMASQGEIILTTDADCAPEPYWIQNTIQCFTPPIGMIVGYAPLLAPPGLFNPLLGVPSLVVAALSAGSIGLGFPLTCSGRNLAYRRKAYDDVHGFEGVGHILGGDDVYLMNKIAKSAYHIAFHHSPNAKVPSSVHTDNQLNRQVRYQSKSLHYDTNALLPALAVYIFHLILFLLPLWFLYFPSAFYTVGLCLVLKSTADMAVLTVAAKRFGSLQQFIWFPILEAILVPYVVIFCALGALMPTKWK